MEDRAALWSDLNALWGFTRGDTIWCRLFEMKKERISQYSNFLQQYERLFVAFFAIFEYPLVGAYVLGHFRRFLQ